MSQKPSPSNTPDSQPEKKQRTEWTPESPATGHDQSPEKIRRMFSDITPTYDRLNFLFSGSLDRRWRRRIAREITGGLEPCARLLDVATGTGDLAAELLKACARGGFEPVVTGADFTRPMLAEGARKYGRQTHRWVEADALALPFADGVFDAATVAFGLRNMAGKATALREMVRVLRPGGRLGILEFSQPENRVLRVFYDAYSYTLMPWLGRLISGSRAYLYLAESIRAFWGRRELAERMSEAGLREVHSIALMGGIVRIHLGTKAK